MARNKTMYLALLRGINVGGKNMIKMAELREALESAGLTDISTYIQTGNIIFSSPTTDTAKLARLISGCIDATFKIQAACVVFSANDWMSIIQKAPKDWGKKPDWKHNILVMIGQHNMDEVVESIGALKPDIEVLVAGKAVLYQSMSRALIGRTTTGKLAGNAVYKQMTIRNYNTAVILSLLLEKPD